MRVLDLPDNLRKYDVEPVIVAGFETRGYEFPTRPGGALRHWTVGGMSATSSLRVVTYGRGQPNPLAGPLCAALQSRESGREDKAYCVASGKANHAGAGYWRGMDSNYDLLGLEIEWQGSNEPFSASRKDVSERIMAALLDCTTGGNDDVAEHREYALPQGRKQDTNLSGYELRRRMAEIRSPQRGDNLMIALKWYKGEPSAPGDQADVLACYRVVTAMTATDKPIDVEGFWVKNQDELDIWRAVGITQAAPATAATNPATSGVRFADGPFANV